MRGKSSLWIISAALALACAHGEDDADSLGGSAPRASSTANGSNPGKPFDVTPSDPSGNAHSSTRAGSGGSGSLSAGAGGSASDGAGGRVSLGGGGSAGIVAGGGARSDGGAVSAAGGASPGSTLDCPTATRVRLPSGECARRITEFSVAASPTSIAMGTDGRIWFHDGARNELVQLDTQGQVVARYGFQTPSAQRELVTGSGDAIVWYTDTQQRTISKRTSQTQVTSYQLDFTPAGIARGAGDDVWVTEANQAVYQIGTAEAGITRWPISASNTIVVGPDQNLWFPSGEQLVRLRSDGSADSFSIPGSASDLCAGLDGRLWFIDGSLDRIGRVDTDGAVSGTYDLPHASRPFRIIAGPDGALWFTEAGSGQIGRITLQGVVTSYPIPTSGGEPYALTVGVDHAIWFTETHSGKIGRLVPDAVE